MRLAAIGFRHGHIWGMLDGLLATGKFDLTALAEDDQYRARAAEKYPKAKQFADWRRCLDESRPDAVTLVTTNDVKGAVIAECLRRGVGVFADKPLFLSEKDLEAARAAYDAAERKPAFSALLGLRTHPPHWTARRLIREGRIGRIVQAYGWRPHKLGPAGRASWELNLRQNGGVLMDLALHDYDFIAWLMNSKATEVTAYASLTRYTDLGDFWDNGQMMVRFASGSTAMIEADWLTPDASPYHGDCRMMILGTSGFIEVFEATKRLLLTTNEAATAEVTPDANVPDLYQDFLAQWEGKGSVLTPSEIFESSRVCLAATASARAAGRKISL